MSRIAHWVVKSTVLVMLLLSLSAASVQAAPLTGGNTIYSINGQDLALTFDPIVRSDGALIPDDVFTALGLIIQAEGRSVTVSRGKVEASLTLGQTLTRIDGQTLYISPPPVRITGRLFLPADVLAELGFEVISKNGYLQVRDLLEGVTLDDGLSADQYLALFNRLTLHGAVRTDENRAYLQVELTYLTPQIVGSRFFPDTFRQRAQYATLLQTNSLVLVHLLNQGLRSATLPPSSLMLVNPATTRQYDPQDALSHNGLISRKIASGASKASVLVYPLLPDQLSDITIFTDSNGGPLGTLLLK